MTQRSRQTELPLAMHPRHGGRRANAGRKRSPNPCQPHRSREPFSRPVPAHVTVRLERGLSSLRRTKLVHEVERTFARGCERSTFRLVHYALQGNHAHLIVEARDRDALGRGMMAIGSRLARAVNRVMDRSGRVFADRYHVHLLKTPREVHRALRYVLLDARKHARAKLQNAARSRAAVLDPASSAKWFDGWRRDAGTTPTATDARRAEPSPVSRARTWLLTVGWRRHGLLDPADVPGGRPSRSG